MLTLDKREAQVLQRAIHQWEQEQLLTPEQVGRLQQSYKVVNTDWQTLTLYIFIAAVSCALMAFGSLVLDEKWIEIIRKKFSMTDGVIALLFGAGSIFLCYEGWRRNRHQPLFSFNRELFWLLPVLSIGVSVVYLGKSLQYLDGNYGVFWLLATVCYGVLGIALRSRLMWIATLLCLVPAYVKLTYYLTGDAAFFLGMNLPCRMALLGVLLIGMAWGLRQLKVYPPIKNISWTGGWLLFIISGWLISIFGNCGTWEEWQQLRQIHLLQWVIVYSLQCVGMIWLGIRVKDDLLRDLGVTFLLLDLYTRYFEYLWDHTNKGLFFGILALSFWWVGRLIEKRMKRN
ncbi:hypothetical protein FHW36_105117 [Chitinophaga polysaccharea]|uniref:Membrane protein DUF2157 n=1 Tax=Chitinophaga polysaccharea TaxID=1293035 RepID=A0A561PNL7_9BACT|nr:hypothetical protein [Chitinophaga polysaccharea]TWF39678.1 hypothetical protein FHW36_105117 [Chitinophaga polysaccharea]